MDARAYRILRNALVIGTIALALAGAWLQAEAAPVPGPDQSMRR